MTSDDVHLIPVKIFRLYPYADVQQGLGVPQSFLVFLKGTEDKVVPITIGQFEGQALAMAIRRIPLPRPLPHNLLQNLLERMKARVHKLVIHTLKEDVFHAYLLVQSREGTFYLDCRPSDGMILATLMNVPIFMTPEVMAEAGRTLEIEREESGEGETLLKFSVPDEEESTGKDDPEKAHARNERELSQLEKLKIQLSRLIAEEAYEEAAKVRDQISELEKK